MSDKRGQDGENSVPRSEGDYPGFGALSGAPSILRSANSRAIVSNSASITLTLPESRDDTSADETPEQRHRRRLRFLQMRREHYQHMTFRTEMCTMTSDEEQTPEADDQVKRVPHQDQPDQRD